MKAHPDHLVLVGPMGVGKTTVGRIVASRLGRRFRDSDLDLEVSGRNGRDLAREQGVPALHTWEAEHLLEALADPEPAVIAAAASVVEDERAVEALRDGPFVVWLWAPPETLIERMARGDHRRDLGADPELALAALASRRDPLYRQLADLTIDIDGLTPDQAAEAIVSRLPAEPTVGDRSGP